MIGAELKALRKRSGLGWARFGAALGYGGRAANIARTVRRLEGRPDEAIPEKAAVMAKRFERKLERLELEWAATGVRA